MDGITHMKNGAHGSIKIQHKYEDVWMKAGIDQAIKALTFQIRRNDELIIELAQRWCSKTNAFVFPWGEATIILEEMKVCWRYFVKGAPISSPLVSNAEKEIEQELIRAFRMFFKSKAKRADHNPRMKHFMSNESLVEHEAILSLWLSRFVFHGRSYRTILISVSPIAIHLARGTKLGLAIAVLASIYRDLSLLNNKIRIVATVELEVTLWAPFQLVQKGDNLKLILDSVRAGNGYIWRPYDNSPALQLYNENDKWVCNNPNFYDELESFAHCLRVLELVGTKCIERYSPNRVAMQFRMDQDIPTIKSKERDMHDHYFERSSEHLLPTSSSVKKESGGFYGPPPSFTSKINTEQEDFDEEGKVSIIQLSDSSDELDVLVRKKLEMARLCLVLYWMFFHQQVLKEQYVC
ncbi:uncharacterized protein [Glycine max]|uniref:uncharacterized protein n=1 Tax=Glycine max TaxID=3847 RepID=UPI0003DED312|nr:uncharacterized protein LOC102666250 [Glycine max]|eukprot:XP_006586571.1 uncharacterized protein LOC102666250 [Glycine max]